MGETKAVIHRLLKSGRPGMRAIHPLRFRPDELGAWRADRAATPSWSAPGLRRRSGSRERWISSTTIRGPRLTVSAALRAQLAPLAERCYGRGARVNLNEGQELAAPPDAGLGVADRAPYILPVKVRPRTAPA